MQKLTEKNFIQVRNNRSVVTVKDPTSSQKVKVGRIESLNGDVVLIRWYNTGFSDSSTDISFHHIDDVFIK